MHGFGRPREELFEAAGGLANAVLVLDKGDADVPFAILAEAEARGDRDIRFLDEKLGEFDRAQVPEPFRNGGPGEHGGGGGGNVPARAAEALGIKVKAIIKVLSDAELVVAQGKENLERRDLSFIERAMFARRLGEQGFDRATIIAALSCDKGDLSRYISLAKEFDLELLMAIGPAPKAGRSRWQMLAKALSEGARGKLVNALETPEFKALDSDGRFAHLLRIVAPKAAQPKPGSDLMAKSYKLDQAVVVQRDDGRTIIIVDEIANPCFGDFLADRLREIYEEFLKAETKEAPAATTG